MNVILNIELGFAFLLLSHLIYFFRVFPEAPFWKPWTKAYLRVNVKISPAQQNNVESGTIQKVISSLVWAAKMFNNYCLIPLTNIWLRGSLCPRGSTTVWICDGSAPGLVSHGQTVCGRFSLGGRSGSEAPFHPPRRLPLCSSQKGKYGPDVTSNKRNPAGIGGGIRPIFCVAPRPAPSWHRPIFLIFCSFTADLSEILVLPVLLLLRQNSTAFFSHKKTKRTMTHNYLNTVFGAKVTQRNGQGLLSSLKTQHFLNVKIQISRILSLMENRECHDIVLWLLSLFFNFIISCSHKKLSHKQ